MPEFIYETTTGFFVQDESEDTDTFSVVCGAILREMNRFKSHSVDVNWDHRQALPPRFGLRDDSPDRWSRFVEAIDDLNARAATNTSYKVFFLGRHGEGFHNVAEAKYGTKAWDEYWSKLNGDGELIWGPDPELTRTGEGQAVLAREAWITELAFNIPLPEKLYCSPLTRAMHTNLLTFHDIITDENRRTVVLENCREENGVHTCDKRRSKSYIQAAYPRFVVEEGLTEEDELWSPNIRETPAQVDERARAVLNYIFEHDEEKLISVTAHGGFINAILRVIGHEAYRLSTGGVIPTIIRAVECEN